MAASRASAVIVVLVNPVSTVACTTRGRQSPSLIDEAGGRLKRGAEERGGESFAKGADRQLVNR